MTFVESIKICLSKYVDFTGRASRSEYWWFFLFNFLGSLLLSLIASRLTSLHWLPSLFCLATFFPSIAVAARRLHDTDRSGWWQLIMFIPLIGALVLLVFLIQSPKEPNRFNPLPPRGPCGF